ncbi:MAG: alpha/beta hydrolase fold domain-containing protein, partial [Oscillospiraceae bacterium]|nr:alpha/beta hydrolase fold domain-containing protein [Oscillospiraceae bacterium]
MERRLVKAETRRIPSDGGTLSLLILRPLRTGAAPVPGVLWLHGGGFQSGSARDVYLTRALSLVTKFGAVLVAPNYRLSRRHPYPAGLRDCYAALLYLKAHADELGVRSDQLMIGGESAGGGLTAALCMLARDRGEVNIAFQMPLYPMLDDRDTPSSVDNHSPNWNTKRNHRAWKRYLRGAYGTERVSCY